MNILPLILLLQDINIEEKLNDAPDDRYQIGVIIGSFLPYVVLVALAYLFYYLAKKRKNRE
jgi:hypothetical protein